MDTQTRSEHTAVPREDELERWRTGAKLGRTIYRMHCSTNENCTQCDELLGMMDSPVVADLICKVMNEWFSRQSGTSASSA